MQSLLLMSSSIWIIWAVREPRAEEVRTRRAERSSTTWKVSANDDCRRLSAAVALVIVSATSSDEISVAEGCWMLGRFQGLVDLG